MIYLNNSELRELHHEDTEIQRVLLGDKIVWENNFVVDLGSSNRYDIKTLLPDLYETLTIDNFFFLTFDIAYGVSGANGWLKSGITRTYYQSGTLLLYAWEQAREYNTHAIMVLKPNRLKSLGFGQTFDLKQIYPNSYQNLTADNFLIKSVRKNNDVFYCNTDGYNYFLLNKSYDSSTGILTCIARDQGQCGGASWGKNWECDVYVYKGRIR